MSKTTVGDVYAKVIDEVCAASRVDFEESGVEHGTLDLLKSVWQKKLSQLNLAQLPWDPKPEPPQAAVSSNAKQPPPSSTSLPSNGHVTSPPSNNSTPGPQIKQEAQPFPPQQAGNSAAYVAPHFPQGGPMNAKERAAMHLHQRYGNQAGPQIAQLQQQQQGSQSRVPVPAAMQQLGGSLIKQEGGNSDQDYQIDSGQAPLKSSQTDGASDVYELEITQRRAAIARYRSEGDRLMRAHFLATQQDLEGGGLLLPLDERNSPIRVKSRADAEQSGGSTLARAQGDAAGDEEEDEDAINSDLDDPDELENADEQEENVHEVMLCTYDKVQRVKNKWKCTLKDGILRVEGSEYVFHKGQGEFEW